MKIDIQRAEDGMRQVYVSGVCGESKERRKCIEDAISEILKEGETALLKEYIGVKNYSGFGDQRCDCHYGMGPRHGSIVFSIGRQSNYVGKIDANAIYYLECERDFIPQKVNDPYRESPKNLYKMITEMRNHQFSIEEINSHLDKQEVDSH